MKVTVNDEAVEVDEQPQDIQQINQLRRVFRKPVVRLNFCER